MSAGDWKDMYAAAESGRLDVVVYHLDNGVDPNYQHPEFMSTPLVASIVAGHDDIAALLLERGADPHLKSVFDDLTPLQAAQRYQRTALAARIDPNASATASANTHVNLNATQTAQPPGTWWRRWLGW